MSENTIKFVNRLKKDVEGGLTSLVILRIIHQNENSWGYMIKQEYSKLSLYNETISDSTLYTTLRKLENKYGLVISNKGEQRRTYNISDYGLTVIDQIYDYWMNFITKSIDYVNILGITKNHELSERLE